MNSVVLIFQLIVLLFSVVIHEVSHGLMALKLGDPTAKNASRLTLNPLKHLDLFGSIILPFLLYFSSHGSFVVGWTKPVPYNPYLLKNPKKAAGLIALAGPLSNFLIALVFALGFRLISPIPYLNSFSLPFALIVYLNVTLMIFNLVPLPPLDGSKILFALLPSRAYPLELFLETYGIFLIIIFIFFGFSLISPLISETVHLLLGVFI